MKWKFWQKEEPVDVQQVPRRFVVPPEKVQHILRLQDIYKAVPVGQDAEAKYLLWAAVVEIFPEVGGGSWRLETPTALRLEIVEKL